MGNNSSNNKSNSKKIDPTKLSDEEMNLLLANTSFKREEILQWHAGFIVSVFFIIISNEPSASSHSIIIIINYPKIN
jgi:hypothetical protein